MHGCYWVKLKETTLFKLGQQEVKKTSVWKTETEEI